MENSDAFAIPDLLRILTKLFQKFPNANNLKLNINNKFVEDCLKSTEETVDFNYSHFSPMIIDYLGYYTYLLILNHCLEDGNKRFFTIFLNEFIQGNSKFIFKEFWSLNTEEQKLNLVLELFNDIEEGIKKNNEKEDLIYGIISPWILRLIVFI